MPAGEIEVTDPDGYLLVIGELGEQAAPAEGSATGSPSRSVPLAADEPAITTPPLDNEVVRWRPYAGEHDIGYVDAEPIGRLRWPGGELDRAS